MTIDATMKQHIFSAIFIVIIPFVTNGYCEDIFVLSNPSTVKYYADSGKFEYILEIEKHQNNYYPCYDKKRNILYFDSDSSVYSAELGRKNSPVSKMFVGRSPALSTDGNRISFLKAYNDLYVHDIESKKSIHIAADAHQRLPAVWISDTKLLYITEFWHTRVIDVISNKISGHWPDGVIPRALSPDGKTLLCITKDQTTVLLYNTDGIYVDTIKKAREFKNGWDFVWSSSGRSFIYQHKTYVGFYPFGYYQPGLDSYDVYMFNIDTRKEERIMSKTVLFGGVCIDSYNK